MLLSAWQPLALSPATARKKPPHSKADTCFHADHRACCGAASEPGCVIPAGGTFEFLLTRALVQHGHRHSDADTSVVSQLLADALLTVPRHIYSYNRRHFLLTRDKILNLIQTHSHSFSLVSAEALDCCGATGASSKAFRDDQGLESVTCKSQLVLAVAQCVSHLLRVDAVLHTPSASHTPSRRPANISSEGSEDEADD